MKRCTHCLIVKELDEFYRRSIRRLHMGDGHDNKCKKCTLEDRATPEKRARANELNRNREKTEAEKECNRKWNKTPKGKECAKRKQRKYRSNPVNIQKCHDSQFLYRKTVAFKLSIQKSREKYPERRAANIATSNAIRSGKIERPSFCAVCNIECTPDGHHPDYSKPLLVIWVCKKCHKEYHFPK